jgi:hypothetical protein
MTATPILPPHYAIQPVRYEANHATGESWTVPCSPGDAQLWALYCYDAPGGKKQYGDADWLDDYKTEADAHRAAWANHLHRMFLQRELT